MHLTAPLHWSRSIGTNGRDPSELVVTIAGMRTVEHTECVGQCLAALIELLTRGERRLLIRGFVHHPVLPFGGIAALDRIERQRDGRSYLVGASFTVADLTAASLLSPLLQPSEIQYPLRVELPPEMQDYRAALLRHPAARWASDIYMQHRRSSMEVQRKAPV